MRSVKIHQIRILERKGGSLTSIPWVRGERVESWEFIVISRILLSLVAEWEARSINFGQTLILCRLSNTGHRVGEIVSPIVHLLTEILSPIIHVDRHLIKIIIHCTHLLFELSLFLRSHFSAAISITTQVACTLNI